MFHLDLLSDELRERAQQALERAEVQRCTWLGEDRAEIAVNNEVDDDAPPPRVAVWDVGRYRKRGADQGNPFGTTSDTVSWLDINGLDDKRFRSTARYIETGRLVTPSQLIGPEGTLISISDSKSSTKEAHLAKLHATLEEEGGVRSSTVMDMATSLDELYTNAVYNAPVGPDGKPLLASTNRDKAVVSPKPVRIQIGYDDSAVLVAVKDSYGSLPPKRLLQVLERCYRPGAVGFEDKKGGAGLGFFLMLQCASWMIVNIKVGVFTEVILFRERMRRKAFMKSSPSLSMCVIEKEEATRTARTYPRVPVHYDALVEIDEQDITCTVLDISRGGAFVAATPEAAKFEIGKTLRIGFDTEQGRVERTGTVRWSDFSDTHRRPGFGIQFTTLLD